MFWPDAESSGPKHESERAASPHDILKQFSLLLADSEPSVPGLTVGVLGSLNANGEVVDRDKGVAVAYRPLGARAEVQFWVSERRAKLLTRTTDPAGIRTEITDRVTLSLGPSPKFAAEAMPSTEAVAAALLALIRRRVADADLTSQDLMTRPYRRRGAGPRPMPSKRRRSQPQRDSAPSRSLDSGRSVVTDRE